MPVNEKGVNYNVKRFYTEGPTTNENEAVQFYGKSVLLLSPHLIVVEIEKVVSPYRRVK